MAIVDIMQEKLDIRIKEAENLKARPFILEKLSKDSSKKVRRCVAKNPKTLPETLAVLANDPDKQVWLNVIDNKNTPLAIVEKAIDNSDLSIFNLLIIAQRNDLAEKTYEYIARKLTEERPKLLKAFKNLK